MKNYMLLLVFQLLVQNIFCNDDFLSKGYVKCLVYADKPATIQTLKANIIRVIVGVSPKCLKMGLKIGLSECILLEFHQHGYKIRDERIQLMSYNKSVFNAIEFKAFKYNRTTTAHNATFNCKIDVQDKIELVVQGYKFLSNEYRHFPVRFQANLKKLFDANVVGMREIKKCGNFTDFYFYKNITYHLCNFVIDENHLPPLIPTGKYMIEATYLYFNVKVFVLNLYGEVYIPIKYPKKNNG